MLIPLGKDGIMTNGKSLLKETVFLDLVSGYAEEMQ